MISILIAILILAIVGTLVWYAVNLLPIPQPLKNIVLAILLLIAAVIILDRFDPGLLRS